MVAVNPLLLEPPPQKITTLNKNISLKFEVKYHYFCQYYIECDNSIYGSSLYFPQKWLKFWKILIFKFFVFFTLI